MAPLGKGLSALLPSGLEQKDNSTFFYCHIDRITPNPDQPRKDVDPKRLEELAASIREKGILQPLVVLRREDNTYQLIAGERRWRAARLADLLEVPVIVRELDGDADQLELALIENVQRQNLNPVEEAESYHRLMTEFNLTQEQVARKVAKERSTVANALRLLQLPPEMRRDIIENRLTAGHARALLAIQAWPELMEQLRREIIDRQLSVRQAEILARRLKKERQQAKPAAKKTAARKEAALPESYCRTLCNNLERFLGVKSKIIQNGSRGKLEIEYYSPDDLERLLALIIKEK